MPQPNGNKMTFTITPEGCLSQKPLPLRVLTGSGSGRFDTIVLIGDPHNTRDVIVSLDSDEASALLFPVPPETVTLAPGHQVVLHIRHDLGLTPRGTFDDEDPEFSRVLAFVDTDPVRCGSGDLNDVVVESGN
jgi:hypothetical protein